MSRSARYVFTVNNPGAWRPTYVEAVMQYLVWEIERGEEGTEHVQGYVRFANRRTLEAAKRLLCERAHLEPARGSEEQNRNYCLKEGQQAEHAEHGIYDARAGIQGRRTDLDSVVTLLTNGILFLDPLKHLIFYGDRSLFTDSSPEPSRRVDQIPLRDYEPSPYNETTSTGYETRGNYSPLGTDSNWEDTPRTGVLPWFVFDQGWTWPLGRL